VQHLGDAGDLRGGLRRRAGVVPGHQHMDVAAAGRGAVTVLRVAPLMGVVVFGNNECSHV
jgi:hypothetical protein